ncbi:MAG: hypothetical protein L0Y72_30760 [Gemmataceae bacterium]|nr:hypothetical protein [Gemmataceae bacterium]MCI0743430.1 hypothetical protein [Gemmataceae bacterium]
MAKSSFTADTSRATPKLATRARGDGTQDIDELREHYDKLNQQRIEAGANLANAQKEFADLKNEAVKEYGTDDLVQLQEMLKQMTAANEQKRIDYQTALEKIEAELAEVEKRYEQSEQGESRP